MDLSSVPYAYRIDISNESTEFCVSECPTQKPKKEKIAVYVNSTVEEIDIDKVYPSVSVFGHCVPVEESVRNNYTGYSKFTNVFTVMTSDIQRGWYVLVAAVIVPLVLCMILFVISQCVGSCGVCIAVIVSLIISLALSVFFFLYCKVHIYDYKSDNLNKLATTHDYISCIILFFMGVLLFVIFLCLLALTFCFNKRLILGGKMLRLATEAMRGTCCVFIVPFINYILFICIILMLLCTAVCFFSWDEPVVYDNLHSFLEFKIVDKKNYVQIGGTMIYTLPRWLVLISLVACIWIVWFLKDLNISTVSGTVSSYYFTRDKKNDRIEYPVGRSLRLVLFHHFGSVALGSLLDLVTCLFRFVFLGFDNLFKKTDSMCVKTLCCCCYCTVHGFSVGLKYINSQAYTMMMIHGKSYLSSSSDTLGLISRHPLQSSVMYGVSSFILFCTSLNISLITTAVCFFLMRINDFGVTISVIPTINYWGILLIVCLFISFIGSYLILSTFDSAIDTLYLCSLQDEEILECQGESNYTMYATAKMKKITKIMKNFGIKEAENDKMQETLNEMDKPNVPVIVIKTNGSASVSDAVVHSAKVSVNGKKVNNFGSVNNTNNEGSGESVKGTVGKQKKNIMVSENNGEMHVRPINNNQRTIPMSEDNNISTSESSSSSEDSSDNECNGRPVPEDFNNSSNSNNGMTQPEYSSSYVIDY